MVALLVVEMHCALMKTDSKKTLIVQLRVERLLIHCTLLLSFKINCLVIGYSFVNDRNAIDVLHCFLVRVTFIVNTIFFALYHSRL